MKYLLVLCLFGLMTLCLSDTKTHSRGCIYIMGKCVQECPVGTHAYATGCGHFTPEASCEQPNPVKETRNTICFVSACYCDPGTVRNKKNNKCVPLDQCDKE